MLQEAGQGWGEEGALGVGGMGVMGVSAGLGWWSVSPSPQAFV